LERLEDKLSKVSNQIKVALATLGCKVNQCESAALMEGLQKDNFSPVPFNAVADIYIINTCTVTAFSDFQSRQLIRRAHRTNPQARIVVTGCYAQIAPDDIASLEGVSLVIGNERKNQITALLQAGINSSVHIFTSDISRQTEFLHMPLTRFRERNRAFLKIQDGCNSFCSYCIVPYARGKSRSMAAPEVVKTAANLTSVGYREIVLTGIHLGAYGHDLNPATNLTDLLQTMINQRWNTRIRLSSIEPREITPGLLNNFAIEHFLCPHLHIPLQSGDDKILGLMKRDYNSRFYRQLIENIYTRIGNIAIGVDVMVGFPGEGEKEFEHTVKLLQDLPVAYLHVFPYSERPGTIAQKIEPKVPGKIKKERALVLRNLNSRKRQEYATRFLGEKLSVLVEKEKDKKTGLMKGFSQNYLPFLFSGSSSAINSIVTVRADKYQEGKVYGKIIIE
jgi:threonylcarbamoyladenosine tRNA methylthiotransferase MtaB